MLARLFFPISFLILLGTGVVFGAGEEVKAQVSSGPVVWNDAMLVSAIILAVTFIGIFTEHIHGFERSKSATAGAVLMVIFGQVELCLGYVCALISSVNSQIHKSKSKQSQSRSQSKVKVEVKVKSKKKRDMKTAPKHEALLPYGFATQASSNLQREY